MSSYTSFAVVGAGAHLGSHIVEQFAKSNANIRVLTRSSAKAVPENVQVYKVDYEDEVCIHMYY